MSFADNADIIRALFEEGWNRGRFENLQGVLHEDAVLHIGSMSRATDLDDLEEIVTGWRSAFDDFRFEIHEIVSQRDAVASRMTLRGKHTGPFRGLDPTGREIAVHHAFFFRFADGKVVEVWEILDQEQLNRQLAGVG